MINQPFLGHVPIGIGIRDYSVCTDSSIFFLTHYIHTSKMKQPTGTEKPETPLAHFETKGAEGYPTFLPAQPQAIGSLLPTEKFPQNAKPAKLFEPLTIRGVTFPNRCWVAPMCMCKSSIEHITYVGR